MNFPHMVSFPGVFPFSRGGIITPEERYLVGEILYFGVLYSMILWSVKEKAYPPNKQSREGTVC